MITSAKADVKQLHNRPGEKPEVWQGEPDEIRVSSRQRLHFSSELLT